MTEMESILFVGGPLHGARLTIPANLWTYAVPVPFDPIISVADILNGPRETPPPVMYSRTSWPYRVKLFPEPVEHCCVMLGPIAEERPPWHESVDHSEADDLRYAHIADGMWFARAEAQLPACVVPGCTEKGRLVMLADEWGRFVGRWWERGEKIRLCHPHYADVMNSQGHYGGIERLPEWLRPEACNLDVLDAMTYYGDPLAAYKARGRVIRVGVTVGEAMRQGVRRG